MTIIISKNSVENSQMLLSTYRRATCMTAKRVNNVE